MNKLRTGDEVLVIAGKDKGKKGIVSAMAGRDRVVVEGVNISKKHQKPNPNKNEPGGITTKTMPIHISNIAIINPDTGKKDKVSIKVNDDGNKIRIFRSSGNEIQPIMSKK
ncbi:50S ribosomal protein L24 [Betaproteobacteria bacterium]|nr:50S ribosomal protein L24 [Betaproteobacteria bacterium]